MKAIGRLITFLTAPALLAANIPVTLVSVTSQQAEVQYTSTIVGACTLSLVDNSGFGVTVWDTNALLTNAATDLARPDTIITGLKRRVLLGHRVYEPGSDGKFYSRSLQADAPHALTVSCGSDSGTLQFATRTIMLGQAYPEMPQYCATGVWNHCWPTIDYSVAGKQAGYVDALTGALVKRVTGPGEQGAEVDLNQNSSMTPAAFSYAKDQSGSSAWTTPNNALTYGTAGYASTSTLGVRTGNTVTNALFLGWAQLGYSQYGWGVTGNNYGASIDDLLIRLHALNSDNSSAISLAIALDGQTAYSPTITRTPTTSDGVILFGDCNSGNPSPITWPGTRIAAAPYNGNFVTWTGPFSCWGSMSPPPRHLLMDAAMTVNVSGTTVTLPAADYTDSIAFDSEWATGKPVYIAGSSCTNHLCTVASVQSTTSMTINESQGTLTGVAFQPSAGILVWKSSGSGSISLNAQLDFATSIGMHLVGNDGSIPSCNFTAQTTSVNADGTSISGPAHTVYLCEFSQFGLYGFDVTAGSSRYLDDNFTYNSSYSANFGPGHPLLSQYPFDATSGNAWYNFMGSTNGGIVPSSPQTTSTGTASIGATSISVASCIDFTAPGEGVFIFAYPNAYYGSLVSCSGGTLTFTPPTLRALSSGAAVGHQESILYKTTYNGNWATTPYQWPDGLNNAFRPTLSFSFVGSHYPNDVGTSLVSTANSCCPQFVQAYGGGLFGGALPFIFSGIFNGYGIINASIQQNSVSWVFPYNISTQTFNGGLDTYSKANSRWAINHSANPEGVGTYSSFAATQWHGSYGASMGGPWNLNVDKVWRGVPGGTGQWDSTTTCLPDMANSGNCTTIVEPIGAAPALALTAAATASGGNTVYTGTISGVPASGSYSVSGFANPNNNGNDFQIVSSTGTTLTLANPNGVAQSGASATARYVPPYAYACPSGTSAYWTQVQQDANYQLFYNTHGSSNPYVQPNPQSPYFGGNNCIQIHVTGQPCESLNPSAAEIATFPCPSAPTTQAWLQDIAVGDAITDSEGTGCTDCEHMVIVGITNNSGGSIHTSTDITLVLYKTSMGAGLAPYPGPPYDTGNAAGGNSMAPGKLGRLNGWVASMALPGWGSGQPWLYNVSNPGLGWFKDTYKLAGTHSIGAAPQPGGLAYCTLLGNYTSYACRGLFNLPGDIGTLNNYQATGYIVAFNGSLSQGIGATDIIATNETYPGGKAVNASTSFKRFITDFHAPNNPNGGNYLEVPESTFPGMTISGPVSTFSHVYDLTLPTGGLLDLKNNPIYGNGGRYRLQDISGPGSAISDSTVNAMCIAYLTGQCFSGSTVGHIYVNVKAIETGTLCYGNGHQISSPCVVPAATFWQQGGLYNVYDPSPEGINFMRLTGMFAQPLNAGHFASINLTPDGSWGFYNVNYAGGYRSSEVFAVRIPAIAQDTVNRSTFVRIPVYLPTGSGYVARFGYDLNFRCSGVTDSQGNFVSGYNDSCLTVANPTATQPYMWSSEGAVSTVTCSGSSNVPCFSIPGISGRYLYWRVERYSGSTLVYAGPTLRLPVP